VQRERRHAKRAEKRRQKEAREPTHRRRLLSKKELAKKGTARKAPPRDATNSPSSAIETSPRKRITPLSEPATPSASATRKRKRPQSDPRSPSPALSVNDVSNSQYSMFNERTTEITESPRKSPTSHSTTVPKRARVNDQLGAKEATKQRPGTSNKGIEIACQNLLLVSTTYRGDCFLDVAQGQAQLGLVIIMLFSTNNCLVLWPTLIPDSQPHIWMSSIESSNESPILTKILL
jgi:hypothetical protein